MALPAAGLTLCAPVSAQETQSGGAVDITVSYVADLAVSASGRGDRHLRYLHDAEVTADVDLNELAGWQGARFYATLLDNRGGRPNDATASLQGIDNIEVGDASLRLFEAYLEQDLGGGVLMTAGLHDLNSTFYVSEPAATLISPSFGIGPELAATGSNGPSIFPSTALALVMGYAARDEVTFARVGIYNAHAATLGDPGGIDTRFAEGVLIIGEAGTAVANMHVSLGAWSYSNKRAALWPTAPALPEGRRPWGVYAQADGPLWREGSGSSQGARRLDAFVRGGFGEGGTTPFAWSAQAGLLLSRVFASRPDSAASLGLVHARTSGAYRALQRENGEVPSGSETIVELTYADTFAGNFSVQPDLQWVCSPGGREDVPDALVAMLRLGFVWP